MWTQIVLSFIVTSLSCAATLSLWFGFLHIVRRMEDQAERERRQVEQGAPPPQA